MFLTLTLNMPSRSGHSVHTVLVATPHKSLPEVLAHLQKSDFLQAKEYFSEGGKEPTFEGDIIINMDVIGKVKEWFPNKVNRRESQ